MKKKKLTQLPELPEPELEVPSICRCINCGFIFRLQPYLGDGYCYPKDYKIITKCPRCGSNAYKSVEEKHDASK